MASEVTHFTDACQWTGASTHDRAKWLSARHKFITASKMSAILGLNPRMDELDVYADMVAPVVAKEEEQGLASPALWGQVLEEPIARHVARQLDLDIVMGGFLLASKRYPRIAATLDAEVRPKLDTTIGGLGIRENASWGVYEGKTVDLMAIRDWNEAEGCLPDSIMIQGQTQLLVTGAPFCLVFALVGGNRPRKVTLKPDTELHSCMVEAVDDFFDRVQRLDPPPPTFRSKRAIAQLYPEEDGSLVHLSREVAEWTLEWNDLRKQRLDITKREDEIRNRIQLAMGAATFGTLPCEIDGRLKRWKCVTETRPERTMKASSSRVMRLVNDNKRR